MSIKSEITGTVDNVDVTGDTPVLKIGDISVPGGQVLADPPQHEHKKPSMAQ